MEPTASWHNTSVFPGQGVYVGPEAILGFYGGLLEEFDAGTVEVEQVAETDAAVVLGLHSRSHGRASQVPLDVHWAISVRIRGDRIARIDVYGSFERAREAAG